MRLLTTFAALLSVSLPSYGQEIVSSPEEKKGELELGIGLAYSWRPAYIGADEGQDYFVPFPYI